MVESAGHAWKILTAAAVISDSQSRYWEETIFFPLAEGSYMLPSAIVISVWVDVANSSLSRAKVYCTISAACCQEPDDFRPIKRRLNRI